jgi:acyl-CoA thioester hydrolase
MGRERVVETTFPVRYAETDQMGVAHHASYVIWMEEGRSQYMRAMGGNYEDLERNGLYLAVSELNLRYLAPAHYGENVAVRTWIESLRSRALTFGYQILNAATRARLADGQVKLILIDEAGRVTRIPDELASILDA